MVAAKTLFIITLTTARMLIPGVPTPTTPGATDFNAPIRTLEMDLTTDKKVDEKSKAECAVPQSLALGPKVELFVDLPKTEKAQTSEPKQPAQEKSEKLEFTLKKYWSCSETVPSGQPKTVKTSDIGPAMGFSPRRMHRARMLDRAAKKPLEGSYAYWPGHERKNIDKSASAAGEYKLTTNYCGGTTVTLDAEQDFLAPLEVVGMDKTDLAAPIKVAWKPVPNAVAYLVNAYCATDKETVTWTSSADPDSPTDLNTRPVSKDDLSKYLDSKVLLPPSATSCTVPAGIFNGMGTPMLVVTAFGVDKIQNKDGIETQVVVRSVANVVLVGLDLAEPPPKASTNDGGK